MYTLRQIKDIKSRAAAYSAVQKKDRKGSKFRFVDNRPVVITQRKQQRVLNRNKTKMNDVTQKKDVVEDIVLKGYKKDEKKIKKDLANCISKFKIAINKALAENLDGEKEKLENVLAADGRDSFFYRSIFKKYKNGLEGDLNRFEEKWSVEKTGGLLADLGLALKRVPMEIFTGGLQFEDIMNDYQQTGSNDVRDRGPKGSEWVKDLEKSKMKGKAGPSSTTTQLLHVVSSIGGFSNEEVEAMMIALVKFWKKKTKRMSGKGYHTAVEVWAPYTGYLDANKNK